MSKSPEIPKAAVYTAPEIELLAETREVSATDNEVITALHGSQVEIQPGTETGENMLDSESGVLAMVTIGDPGEANNLLVIDLKNFSESIEPDENGNVVYTNVITGKTVSIPRASARYAVITPDNYENNKPGAGVRLGESLSLGNVPEGADAGDQRTNFEGQFTNTVGESDVVFIADQDSEKLTVSDKSEYGTVVVETAPQNPEKTPEETAAEIGSVAVSNAVERPISGRRAAIEAPTATNPEDAELVSRLTNGRLNRLATRIEATRDMRSDRKHIRELQKQGLDKLVDEAISEKWGARSNRLGVIAKNNVLARTFGDRADERKQRRSELRALANNAIANARIIKNEKRNRDPDTTSKIDKIRRVGARMKSWNMARQEIRDKSKASMEAAKQQVVDSKADIRDKRDRRAKLSKFRGNGFRRTTLSGREINTRASWNAAGGYMNVTREQADLMDDQKKKLAEARAKKYMETIQKNRLQTKGGKVIDPKERWKNRTEPKRRSDRTVVEGPKL